MKLSELTVMGAFIPDGLVKKEIKFKLDDGEERKHDIFIRRLSIGVHEQIWAGGDESQSRTARLLSAAVRLGEDGKEQMTYDQAFRLDSRIALAMTTAIQEVNGAERKN